MNIIEKVPRAEKKFPRVEEIVDQCTSLVPHQEEPQACEPQSHGFFLGVPGNVHYKAPYDTSMYVEHTGTICWTNGKNNMLCPRSR